MLRAASQRTMGPWMQGPKDAVHATVELGLLLSGEVVLAMEGGTYRSGPGTGVLIPAGVVHTSWTESEPVTEIVVHLDADALASRVGPLRAGHRPFDADEARIMARAARGEPVLDELIDVVRRFGEAGRPWVDDERLRRVVDAVGAALDHPWTVEELAKLAAMSPAHFSRSFRETLGEPPLRWVQGRRLDRAEWLMLHADRSLTAIAHDAGFRSSSRLTEAFQRRHGLTPSAWKALRGPGRT